jgi:hypothetical protein
MKANVLRFADVEDIYEIMYHKRKFYSASTRQGYSLPPKEINYM